MLSSIGQVGVRRLIAPARLVPFKFHRRAATSSTTAESDKGEGEGKSQSDDTKTDKKVEDMKQKKKTMAQLDEEMRQAMEGIAGDGGEAGAELEDGKPVAMKRSVKENMFRYI